MVVSLKVEGIGRMQYSMHAAAFFSLGKLGKMARLFMLVFSEVVTEPKQWIQTRISGQ